MMGVGYKGKKAMAQADDVQSYDYFWDRANVELKFSFWPRKCYESKKRIFGPAYRARRIITGPGEPVVEDRWLAKDEYLWGLLSGKYARSN